MAPSKTLAKKAPSKTLAKKAPDAETNLATRIEDLREAGKLAETQAEEGALDQMVDRITTAQTEDDILGGSRSIGELVGDVIVLNGVNFLESKLREGYFAVVTYGTPDDANANRVATAGSIRLMAQCVALLQLGKIPGQVVKVASASVEYEPGHFGDTFFFEKVR